MSVARDYLANATYSSTIGIVFTRMAVNGDLESASCQKRTNAIRVAMKCPQKLQNIGKKTANGNELIFERLTNRKYGFCRECFLGSRKNLLKNIRLVIKLC